MRREGFTLVEVLVSLAIFAVIAAAGAALLGFTIDNRAAVTETDARTAQLVRLRALMKADLEQAAPRRFRDANGQAQMTAFIADPAGQPLLSLTRRGWMNPGQAARPSLQRVEYRVVDGRLERTFAAQVDGARPEAPQVLFDGVQAVALTFYSNGAASPTWMGTPERPLPEAVRVSLTLDRLGQVDQWFLIGAGAA